MVTRTSFIFSILLLTIISCKTKSTDNKKSSVDLRYEVVSIGKDTFAYKIFINGQLNIFQKHIPAIGGHRFFTDSILPRVLAEKVIFKLSNNDVPSLFPFEVKSAQDSITQSK